MNTVVIRCPTRIVFAYLADLENVPAWNYAIESTTKVTEGPVGVGTTYRQIRTIPRRSEETLEVTAFAPDHTLAIRGMLGPFAAVLEYRLEPIDEGTRVTNEVELRPRGVLGVIGSLASSRVRGAVAANLAELRRRLESQPGTT